jgi:cell division topological specificity factor
MKRLTKIFNLLKSLNAQKKTTAGVAKERLQIIISHERTLRGKQQIDIAALKQELLAVIKKYVSVSEEQISVQLERENDYSILELNVTLPNDARA